MQRVARRGAIPRGPAGPPAVASASACPAPTGAIRFWPMNGLGRTDANFAPLSPLGFLPRSASIYPDRVAMVHGERRIVYRDFDRRARRLASALARRGIGPGDTVSAVLPNPPPPPA